MSEHPNAAVLRRAYEAFVRGDFAVLGEVFAPDITWHVPGRSQVAGAHRGREAVFAYFGQLMALTGGTFKAEPRDIAASDAHAYSLEHLTGERAGKTLDVDLALVVSVRDGQIIEARDFFSDQTAWDEFWA
jgi:ketosteroid isomerase-like protein